MVLLPYQIMYFSCLVVFDGVGDVSEMSCEGNYTQMWIYTQTSSMTRTILK